MLERSPLDPALVDESEILAFGQKQKLFDQFAAQLQAEPAISYLEDPLSATAGALAQWQRQHQAVEQDVARFDKGDLARWRALARAATGKSMSKNEIDLVEVVLKTLLSLDKVISLLRERGKLLGLVEIRMRWEEHLDAAAAELSLVRDGVSAFLKVSRWSPPVQLPDSLSTAVPPLNSRQTTVNDAQMTEVDVARVVADAEAARHARCGDLARLAAQQDTHILDLTTGAIFKAGECLDQLIDESPEQLPDSFLDRHENLEKQIASHTEGLGSFLLSMPARWKVADETFWSHWATKQRADQLSAEIEASKLHRPGHDLLNNFSDRLRVLREAFEATPLELADLAFDFARLYQPEASATAEATLRDSRRQADEGLRRAEALLASYRALLAVLGRAKEADDDLKALIERARRLQADILSHSVEDNAEAILGMLEVVQDSRDVDPCRQRLAQDVETSLRKASALLVDLGALREPAVRARRGLSRSMGELQETMQSLEAKRSTSEQRRKQLEEVRGLWVALDGLHRAIGRHLEHLRQSFEVEGWPVQTSPSQLASWAETLAHVSTTLPSSSLPRRINKLLQDRLSECQEQFDSVEAAGVLGEALNRQHLAVQATGAQFEQLAVNLRTLSTVLKIAAEVPETQRHERRARLAKSLHKLRRKQKAANQAAQSVPFVESVERQLLIQRLDLALDLKQRDRSIRDRINQLSAATTSQFEAAARLFAASASPDPSEAVIERPPSSFKPARGLVEDVFGPSTSSSVQDSLRSAPSSSPEPFGIQDQDGRSTPASSVPEADKQEELERLDAELQNWLSPAAHLPTAQRCDAMLAQMDRRLDELSAASKDSLGRLRRLVEFEGYSQVADERLSRLVDVMDRGQSDLLGAPLSFSDKRDTTAISDSIEVDQAIAKARSAVDAAQAASYDLSDDARVRARVASLLKTRDELLLLREEQDATREAPERVFSEPKPMLKRSISDSTLPADEEGKQVGRVKGHQKSRSASMSIPRRMPSRPSSEALSRGASRTNSRADLRTSASIELGSRRNLGWGRPSVMPLARPKARGSEAQRDGSRSSRGGSTRYRANPQQQLDVEVGKIVNALPVYIPICSAQADKSGARAGSYWIGDPDPKLYYCRILRSQSVMVRVGGGWMRLEDFLTKHFAHLFTLPTTAFGEPQRCFSAESVRASLLEQAQDTATPPISRSASGSMPHSKSSPHLARLELPTLPSHKQTVDSLRPNATHADVSPRRHQPIWR